MQESFKQPHASPQDVMDHELWKLVGCTLLSSNCSSKDLVTIVHVLMGRPAPCGLDVLSPVSRYTSQQHHTDTLLANVASAAEASSSNQLAHMLPTAHSQPSTAQAATATSAAASDLFDKSMDMLTAHLQQMGLDPSPARLQLASDPQMLMVKAAIAPFAQHHAQLQAEIGSLRSEVRQITESLKSRDSFIPLTAVALTQLSQQLHGMQKTLGTVYHQPGLLQQAGAAHATGRQSHARLAPQQVQATTPAKKQAARLDKAQNIARKQLQAVADRMDNPALGMGSHASASLAAAAIALAGPASALAIVYPGRGAEPFWTSWNGRWGSSRFACCNVSA